MELLTFDERQTASKLFLSLLLDGADPLPIARGALGGEGDLLLGNVAMQHSPQTWAVELVRICEQDGWAHDPCFLYRLLAIIPGPLAELEPILAKLGARPAAVVSDPFYDLRLVNDRPFLDRHQLRQALKQLAAVNGTKKILVVKGPTLSGKSYTAELVDHLSVRTADFFWARVELLDGDGATMGPAELARQIALRIGVVADPPPLQPPEIRWAQTLAVWLLAQRAQTRQRWWVVIDGFDNPDVPDLTHVFLEHLAVESVRPLSRDHVRLLLLDYGRPLPAEILPMAIEDEIEPHAIGEVDLRDYFDRLIKASGRSYAKDVVDVAVQQVLTRVEGGGARMPEISRLLEEVTRALIAA